MCALIIVSTLWIRFPIPGTDVMFTTQVFFVLLCGQLLPPRYCLYTLLLYVGLALLWRLLPKLSSVRRCKKSRAGIFWRLCWESL